MQYRKNYILLPFVVITISVLFQLCLVGQSVASLLNLHEKYSNQYPVAWSLVFTLKVKCYLVFTFLALISLLIYWFIEMGFLLPLI